jgi:hypothetical protein
LDEADGREIPGRNESECVEFRKALNEEADSLWRLEGTMTMNEMASLSLLFRDPRQQHGIEWNLYGTRETRIRSGNSGILPQALKE